MEVFNTIWQPVLASMSSLTLSTPFLLPTQVDHILAERPAKVCLRVLDNKSLDMMLVEANNRTDFYLQVERERGITVKAQTCTMIYKVGYFAYTSLPMGVK